MSTEAELEELLGDSSCQWSPGVSPMRPASHQSPPAVSSAGATSPPLSSNRSSSSISRRSPTSYSALRAVHKRSARTRTRSRSRSRSRSGTPVHARSEHKHFGRRAESPEPRQTEDDDEDDDHDGQVSRFATREAETILHTFLIWIES